MKILFFSMLVILFSGCSHKQINPTTTVCTLPNDFNEHSINTGDVIFSKYSGYQVANLTSKLSRAFMLGGKFEAFPGSKFIEQSENNEKLFCSKEKYYIDFLVGPSSRVCLKDTNNDGIFDLVNSPMVLFGKFLPIEENKPTYQLTTEAVISNNFTNELIYNGLSNNTVFIQYREFSNNLARPSFFQELKYQYNGQPITIRFKDIKIQLLDVDNNGLKYKVLP